MEGKKYLGDLVKQYHERSGLSYSQIEKRTGVPAKTITSWARGLSKRPRNWQDLINFAKGLELTLPETDELLTTAGHRIVNELRKNVTDKADQKLLSNWNDAEPIFQVRRGTVNYRGRVEAQAAVKTALESEEQLCVIQGMGGIGKSTLAIEIATQLQTKYRDGVLWGDLRLMSNDEVLDSWASLIGIPFPQSASAEAKATNMWGVLSRKSFLIVLDDAVSLTQVRQLLPPHQTECGLLITTRDKEVANGLVNNSDNIVSLAPMRPETSMALFEDILGNNFIAKHTNTLGEIAVLLGHLPLALNIYARRQKSSSQSPQAALERMHNIQRKLAHLKVGDEAVRTAFEQSWELLDPGAQAGFKQMAVFAGRDFGIDAFTAIGQLDPFDADDILDQLQKLFLVSPWGETGNRFQQHTLLAAWSHELLQNAKDLTETNKLAPFQRMSEFYLEYAKEHLEDEQALAIEWGNVMGGMQASDKLSTSELTLDYIDTLEPHWLRKGYYTDARQGYDYGVNAAKQLGDKAKEAWQQYAWGSACVEQSDFEEAELYLTDALRYMEETDNTLGIGTVNLLLADVKRFQGDMNQANQQLQLAWSKFQELEDIAGLASSLLRMGNIYIHMGNIDDAIRIGEDALKSLSQFDNKIDQMRCYILIGYGYDELGEHEKAQAIYDKLKDLVADLSSHIEISEYYYAYANHLMCTDQFDQAEYYGLKSRDLFRVCGDLISEGNALNNLASNYVNRYRREGDKSNLKQAQQLLDYSVKLFEQTGYQLGILIAEYTQGRILYFENKVEEACTLVRSCLTKAKQLQHTAFINKYSGFIDLLC